MHLFLNLTERFLVFKLNQWEKFTSEWKHSVKQNTIQSPGWQTLRLYLYKQWTSISVSNIAATDVSRQQRTEENYEINLAAEYKNGANQAFCYYWINWI